MAMDGWFLGSWFLQDYKVPIEGFEVQFENWKQCG